jgi:hypothetical protein
MPQAFTVERHLLIICDRPGCGLKTRAPWIRDDRRVRGGSGRPSPPFPYGDGVTVGQFGAAAPFESVQFTRPVRGACTVGLSGELAAM